MSIPLPEGLDERYRKFYELLSQCTESSCPTAYYDYTAKCTVDICPISSSYWDYLPSLPANGIFIALFALSLACYLVQALLWRKFRGFTIAMVGGCILEVLGYAGRIMAYHSPWNQVRRRWRHGQRETWGPTQLTS